MHCFRPTPALQAPRRSGLHPGHCPPAGAPVRPSRGIRPPSPPAPLPCPTAAHDTASPGSAGQPTQEGGLGVSGALGAGHEAHAQGHQPGCWLRPPQGSTHCRYLCFFLRSRENSLVFFLWGWRGRGGLHLREMWDMGWPVPIPQQQPLTKGLGKDVKPPNAQGP